LFVNASKLICLQFTVGVLFGQLKEKIEGTYICSTISNNFDFLRIRRFSYELQSVRGHNWCALIFQGVRIRVCADSQPWVTDDNNGVSARRTEPTRANHLLKLDHTIDIVKGLLLSESIKMQHVLYLCAKQSDHLPTPPAPDHSRWVYPPKTLTEHAGRGAARSEEMFDVRPLQTP